MIRLQAAKMIRVSLHEELHDDRTIHFNTYEGKILRAYTDQNNVWSEWEPVSWKEVLKFIRDKYQQLDEECCKHKFEVWNKQGTHLQMKVKCVNPYQHFHCKACEATETATGVCDKLCFDCQQKADKVRESLTKQILDYEGQFGIKFAEIKEWRDQFNGEYDYDYRSRTGEDFHADG